jgi:tetratricopeptide (TPR) repeat protein
LSIITLLPISSLSNEVYGVSGETVDFYRGNKLLGEWRVAEAREAVDSLKKAGKSAVAADILDAHVRFFEGRYSEALKILDEYKLEDSFRELVKVTADSAAKFKSREKGHFRVYWDNPRDEVMADEALEALDAAQKALEKELGFIPEGVVRVEIYPGIPEFTAVSTLTKTEVETSGTIGLCKFNRIMIASPRSTVWGYRWLDTLAHEYVHLAIFRMSAGRAPIWIHEGLARHFEGAWRGRTGRETPFDLALLTKRFKAETLIPLEKMSPSVAKLPSAEDTSLAFAQVSTMMGFLAERKGAGALPELVRLIGGGTGDRAAVEAVWGGSFASFEEAWKEWVRSLPPQESEVEVLGIELKGEGGERALEPGRISDPGAEDYSRLGDMLRSRGRMKAAAVEYEKAFGLSPKTPSIVSRYALGRLSLGEYEKALSAVDGVIGIYEDRGVLWSRKGEALMGLGRYGEAYEAFAELMEINPFDEPGRMGLVEAAKKSGRTADYERQLKLLKILTSEGAAKPHP